MLCSLTHFLYESFGSGLIAVYSECTMYNNAFAGVNDDNKCLPVNKAVGYTRKEGSGTVVEMGTVF